MLPSGDVKIAIENGHLSVCSGFFHEKLGEFPVRYVKLPEAISASVYSYRAKTMPTEMTVVTVVFGVQ